MAEKATNQGSTPAAVVDPYRGYNFRIEVEGLGEAAFSECTGLGASIQAIRYAEGRSPVVRRIPGQVDYADVTLRYGLTNSPDIWNWIFEGLRGRVVRRNVSVILYDTTGTAEVMRWNLMQAWVSKWRAAPLDALGQEIAIETITIVFEQLDRAPAPVAQAKG
jgi:phage tail-like protein